MSTTKSAASKFPRGPLKESQRERKERDFLQAKVDAALESGPAVDMTDEDWETLAAGAHVATRKKVVARNK